MSRYFLSQSVCQKLVFLVLCAGLAACSHKKPKKDAELEQDPKIQAESPQVQQEFDQAMEDLSEGKWAEASAKFKAIKTKAPGDPVVPLASLYAARAELGTLAWGTNPLLPETGPIAPGSLERVASKLRSIASQSGVDSRVRYAATLYEALVHVLARDMTAALEALGDYPGASVSYAVLPEDRTFVRWVLAEGLAEQGRGRDLVEAAAMLFDTVSEQEGTAPKMLRHYARGRALDAMEKRQVEFSVMQLEWLPSKDSFLRAMASWGILWQRMSSEDYDAEVESEQLELIAQDGSQAMLAIGELEAVAEMRYWMATKSSVRRPVLAAVVPMTGKSRGVGERAMRGHLLAQKAFSHGVKSGGATLVFYDSEQPAKVLVEKFKKDGVLAVMGPLDKNRVGELEALVSAAKLPMITMTTGFKSAEEGKWALRFFLSPQDEATRVTKVSASVYKDRHLVILEPDTGYGASLTQAAKTKASSLGQKVSVVPYVRKENDFTKAAKRVAALKPDAIFIPDTGNKVAALAAALSRQNIWGVPGDQKTQVVSRRHQVHYLGTSLWQGDFVLKQAGKELAGALVPYWFSPQEKRAASTQFYLQYASAFSGTPGPYDVFAYDASRWLTQLITESGIRSPGALRKALRSSGYSGVTGDSEAAQGARVGASPRFLTIKSSQFTPVTLKLPAPVDLPPKTIESAP